MTDSAKAHYIGREAPRTAEACFGYVSLCREEEITLKELRKRLHVIAEMSSGMAAVMSAIIDRPDTEYETAGIARLICAGADVILEQTSRLEPRDCVAASNDSP